MSSATKFAASLLLAATCTMASWPLPAVGNTAPDFTAYRYGVGDSVTLSALCGTRHVVLIFGSHT